MLSIWGEIEKLLEITAQKRSGDEVPLIILAPVPLRVLAQFLSLLGRSFWVPVVRRFETWRNKYELWYLLCSEEQWASQLTLKAIRPFHKDP